MAGEPEGAGVARDLDMKDAAPVVGEHDEGVEPPEEQAGRRQQVDCGDGVGVLGEEGGPRAAARPPTARDHIFRDARLAKPVAQEQQLAMNAWRAPEGVLPAHLANERNQLRIERRAPAATARAPAPIHAPEAAMPSREARAQAVP